MNPDIKAVIVAINGKYADIVFSSLLCYYLHEVINVGYDFISNFDYSVFIENPTIVIYILLFVIIIAFFIYGSVSVIDFWSNIKRYSNIKVNRRTHDLIIKESKYKAISEKKLIEDIILNHFRFHDYFKY